MKDKTLDNINVYWKQIYHYLKKRSGVVLSDLGITKVDANILLMLYTQGEQTKAALAGLLSFEPHSLTRSLERLVSEQYVNRIIEEDDRRYIKLSITASGKNIVENYLADHQKIWGEILGDLSHSEITKLEQTLESIRNRVVTL